MGAFSPPIRQINTDQVNARNALCSALQSIFATAYEGKHPFLRVPWLTRRTKEMRKNSFEVVKFGFRPDEAAHSLGSEKLLQEFERAGWIKPRLHRHKLKLFDKGDLARCWQRILNGEEPFPVSPDKPAGGVQRANNNTAVVAVG
jgi:hypothetical protein